MKIVLQKYYNSILNIIVIKIDIQRVRYPFP